MVVGGELTGLAFIFDTSNPEEVKLLDEVEVNAAPWHPVFSPDGQYAYFGNKRANTITVLDVENREVPLSSTVKPFAAARQRALGRR